MSNTMNAQHILVEHEHQAQDALKKIEEGVSFDDVAKSFSICPSGKRGGHLGVFKKGQMVPDFEKAVLDLDVGDVSEPIKTRFGYHVIKRLG